MSKKSMYVFLCLSCLAVMLLPMHEVSAAMVKYDDFSSGDLSNWNVNNSYGYLSVVAGSSQGLSQPYVLHVSGTGQLGNTFVGIGTKNTFSGSFGAAYNFFNFSSTFTYNPSDPAGTFHPSVHLQIGDFTSSSSYFYTVGIMQVPTSPTTTARAIGWGEINPATGYFTQTGGSYNAGAVLYSATSGAAGFIWDVSTHTLNLGYYTSTNPSTWTTSNFNLVHTFTGVNFANDPSLRIIAGPGARGTLTADVGGLYTTVPVPPALLLFGSGILGLLGIRRKLVK